MTRSPEWGRLEDNHLRIIEKHQTEPRIQLGLIAKELGLIVRLATLPANISGEIRQDQSAPSGYIIRINRHESRERQRFSLAHEIAHYLLHRSEIGDGVIDDVLYRSKLTNRKEAEANRLAADLIMPWDMIRSEVQNTDIRNDEARIEIADRFGVSIDALDIRLGLR